MMAFALGPILVRNIFQLQVSCILCLIQNNKGIIQGSTTHICKRRNLDGFWWSYNIQACLPESYRPVHRTRAADMDQFFSFRSPGKKPRLSPASTAGRVRIIFFTSLFFNARTAKRHCCIGFFQYLQDRWQKMISFAIGHGYQFLLIARSCPN